MNSHADIQRRLPAYCGGDLESAERQLIELHLAECPACRVELADLQTTMRQIRSTPEVDPPPWLTARIMAHIKAAQPEKRSWLQRMFFPLHIKLPLEAVALLMVCVSGYYLSRTVETSLEQTRQQQLQEIPAQPAPATLSPYVQPPDGSDKQKRAEESRLRKDATQTVIPETAQPPEYRHSPVIPASPPASAPAPPAHRNLYDGAAESMRAAPATEYIRDQEAAPEKKLKSSRSPERQTDEAAPAAAGRAAGTPAGKVLLQALVRLNVDDPAAAATLIREAALRSGGEIVNERDFAGQHLTVRLPAERQKELLERLERLGRITERPAIAPGEARLLELTIQW